MKTLAYLEIPKMFPVYANSISYETGQHEVQYFCAECQQLFNVSWGRANTMGYGERGYRFHCPHCGTYFDRDKTGWGQKHESVPRRMSFLVRERKHAVDLEIRYSAYQFRGQYDLLEIERKEMFRFEPKARQALWWRQGFARNNQQAEISFSLGSPIDFLLFENSILGHINAGRMVERSQLTNVMRTLREAVEGKMQETLGHAVESTWVSYGEHGMLLLPLYNLAFRTVFPDAPNLPDQYRASTSSTKHLLVARGLADTERMERAVEESRTGTDYITSFLRGYKIPNIDSARRAAKNDWFDLGAITTAFEICSSPDLAMRLFQAMGALQKCYLSADWLCDMKRMAEKLASVYGPRGFVRLVEKAVEYRFSDCLNLFKQITDLDTAALKQVRLRGLHDGLMKQHWLQKNKNIDLNVPDHIVRRLAMQQDRLRFFLPKESMDLFEAGKSLHNCVASYGQAVKDRKKWIVLVADDTGKLAACLEIQNDKLVQAKIDSNKSVGSNAKLNAAVLAWAQDAGIKIQTPDVKQPTAAVELVVAV